MRIFITGGDGQLGQALLESLAGHEVTAVDLPDLDIVDKQGVFERVAAERPDVLIHCAAMTDVDGCARDPETAHRVNALGTQNVALACQAQAVEMVHISTNEVFSGTRHAGYEEWMPLDPINPYGRSKAAAETHVKQLLNRFYIVRTAWLYADGGRNFIHAILKRARANGRLRVVTDEIGNPTYARDLAQAIAALITTHQYGIYHFVNKGACSRWAFANEIIRQAGPPNVQNTPILSKEYPRPSTPPPNGMLHNHNGRALGITLRPWQEALADYLTTINLEK